MSIMDDFVGKMQQFENNVLTKDSTYTIEYREKLDKIKRSVILERIRNYEGSKAGLKKFKTLLADTDNYKVQFKFLGIEFDLSPLIKKMKK